MVLAYGLCGGVTAGLHAGSITLVIPRAHDFITIFLGSRDRYPGSTEHPRLTARVGPFAGFDG